MKKILKTAASLILCIALIAGLTACGEPDDIDISGYKDRVITIRGADEKPVKLTIADLKKMDCETVTTESTSDKIGEVRATGPWLDTVLEPYGIKQEELKKLLIKGKDGYDIKLLNDYLKEHPIMLSFGSGGKPLDEECAPCRIIIEKSDSAYWVRQVREITLVK